MAKKSKQYNRYTVRATAPNTYMVSKMSPDMDVLGTYTVTENVSGSLHCDCPAHKPWCRHCDMLRKFQAEERLGTGWFYIPESSEWLPPVTDEAE